MEKIIIKLIHLNIFIVALICFGINEKCKAQNYNEEIKIYDEILSTEYAATEQIQESTFEVPDENWISTALKDIAYYIRNYKFNEWDRRYSKKRQEEHFIGYFNTFPLPKLTSLDWKIRENCEENFYKCVIYLHSVIETVPLSRNDDTAVVLNTHSAPFNQTTIQDLDYECKKALLNSDKTSLPFDGPLEKFEWRTSAAYYMCWYTMLGSPALTMLGERCDNFANCLDLYFGPKNNDPRSDDRVPFACALYSFCPDPCCPLKHIQTFAQCYERESNPCFAENRNGKYTEKECKMDRKRNQNLKNMILNHWNVSCSCKEKGFIWNSNFGMCVDINECITGQHTCNRKTEDCLNLIGSFECICKWGYAYDHELKECKETKLFAKPEERITLTYNSVTDNLKSLLKYYLGI